MNQPSGASASLVVAVARSYRGLRAGMAAFLERRPRDAQLLVLAMLAGLIGFLAGLPRAVEQARTLNADDPLTAVMSVRLFGAIFVTPLFLFAVAAVGRLVSRLARGRGSFWSARAALVWAVMVAQPLVIANGLVGAVATAVPATAGAASMVSVGLAIGFLWIWAQHLAEAEGFRRGAVVFGLLLLVCATPFVLTFTLR